MDDLLDLLRLRFLREPLQNRSAALEHSRASYQRAACWALTNTVWIPVHFVVVIILFCFGRVWSSGTAPVTRSQLNENYQTVFPAMTWSYVFPYSQGTGLPRIIGTCLRCDRLSLSLTCSVPADEWSMQWRRARSGLPGTRGNLLLPTLQVVYLAGAVACGAARNRHA